MRLFAEPSLSDFGVVGELFVSAAAPRCMNFMVIKRDDIVLGVDCCAILGSADRFCAMFRKIVEGSYSDVFSAGLEILDVARCRGF